MSYVETPEQTCQNSGMPHEFCVLRQLPGTGSWVTSGYFNSLGDARRFAGKGERIYQQITSNHFFRVPKRRKR
jgi:hypothetical protein